MSENLKTRVSFLRGLAEGLQLEDDTRAGRVLASVIDVLGDVAAQIEGLKASQAELETYVESLDEDLSCVEEDVYFGDEDDTEGADAHVARQTVAEVRPGAGGDGLDEGGLDDREDREGEDADAGATLPPSDSEPTFLRVECPNCGERVFFEESLIDDDYTLEITCPNCGELICTNDDDLDTGEDARRASEPPGPTSGMSIDQNLTAPVEPPNISAPMGPPNTAGGAPDDPRR